MNLNFFTWIREGVRQSVLLGVSDALDDIGTAPHGDDLKQHLHSALGRRSEAVVDAAPAKPKRLGRSLKDLEQPKA